MMAVAILAGLSDPPPWAVWLAGMAGSLTVWYYVINFVASVLTP
jgi:hypothetical protein